MKFKPTHLILIFALFFGLIGLWISLHSPRDPKPFRPQDKVVVEDVQRFNLREGKGASASAGQFALIKLKEMTARGQVIRDDFETGRTEWVQVASDVKISSLGFLVESMKQTGLRRATLPWGEEFNNTHESGEPLIFEIELLDIKTSLPSSK